MLLAVCRDTVRRPWTGPETWHDRAATDRVIYHEHSSARPGEVYGPRIYANFSVTKIAGGLY
jgi:hypothetical protein